MSLFRTDKTMVYSRIMGIEFYAYNYVIRIPEFQKAFASMGVTRLAYTIAYSI